VGLSETTVLLDCLDRSDEAAAAERLALVSPQEWYAVIAQAHRHNVKPLLYHRVKRLGITLPAEAVEELRRAYLKNATRNMLLAHEVAILLRRLQEHSVPIILLKGVYLAEQVYEDIGLRSMSDVDLLVRAADVSCVEQALLAEGFEPSTPNRIIGKNNSHFGYTLPALRLLLEVHWTLIGGEGQFGTFPIEIDVAGLWARAQPLTLEDSSALALSLDDLILHLCLHTAKHAHELQLRMLCDIAEIIRKYGPDIDWEAVGARAQSWGIVRSVYLVLRLSRDLLGAAVPADWLVALRPSGFEERYLALARELILGDAVSALAPSPVVARLWGPANLASKLAMVWRSLALPRETLARMYPAPADSWRIWLYYPVRARDVLARHGAAVWRLICGSGQARVAAERTNEVTALHDWMLSA
jgi:hypothetical protein